MAVRERYAPSAKWFPSSLTDRAAWYGNFNTNIQEIGLALGLTTAELAVIQADCDMLRFLASGTVAIKAFVASFEDFRRVMTEGKPGTVTPDAPFLPVMTPPADGETGIFVRLERFVARIRTAPGFTPETAAALGIAPTRYRAVKRHLEADASPEIKAIPRAGSVVSVKFVRGASSGLMFEMLIDNETIWQGAGRFLKSPVVITIPQNTEKLPRNVQIRARFLEGNDPVGDWSQIATVQTIP